MYNGFVMLKVYIEFFTEYFRYFDGMYLLKIVIFSQLMQYLNIQVN